MKVLYSPQVNPNKKIEYKFIGETIIATFEKVSDTFDFSSMPEGEIIDIETTLSVNPITFAKRENGILYVELLNFIAAQATEEEKFPKWQVK
jgi:hypothetical protein